MKQGELKSIFNKNKKFGENKFYNITYLKGKNDKQPKPFLFTDDQLADAALRASKNKEDIQPLSTSYDTLDKALLMSLGFLIGVLCSLIVA